MPFGDRVTRSKYKYSYPQHLIKQQPSLNISERDVKCVQIAALTHDLGHGPFSHTFERFIEIARPYSEWTHELASEDMLTSLIIENELDSEIDCKELSFIKDLIHGAPRCLTSQREKLFLFDIVCNKRNSVDVDKYDYIQRDCRNIGMPCSVDSRRFILFLHFVRLIMNSRVVENHICFNQKEAYNLYEVINCFN
jgi:HD superfamily phosphohydrolase